MAYVERNPNALIYSTLPKSVKITKSVARSQKSVKNWVAHVEKNPNALVIFLILPESVKMAKCVVRSQKSVKT